MDGESFSKLVWPGADPARDSRVVSRPYLYKETPVSLSSSILTNREARVRATRQDDDLRLPSVRTEAGRRRFLYRGPMWYNALPADMPNMSVRRFTATLKQMLLTEE